MIRLDGGRQREIRVRLLGGTALVLLMALCTGCQLAPKLSLVEQGEEAYARGAYEEADGLFARALARDANNGRALHGRARIALVRDEAEAALRLYSDLSKRDRAYFKSATRDDYALTLLEAAKGRLGAEKVAGAIQALRVLQRVKPSQKGLSDLLSRALTARGRQLVLHAKRAEAMKHFEEAIKLAPHSAGPYIGAAEILLATGRNREALALLTEARKHNASDGRLRALTVEAMGVY